MKYIKLLLSILGFFILNAVGLSLSSILMDYLSKYFKSEYAFNIISYLLMLLVVIANLKLFVRKNTMEFIKLKFKDIDKREIIKVMGIAFLINVGVTAFLLIIKKYYVYNFIWNKLYIEDIVGVLITGIIVSFSSVVIEELMLRGFLFNKIPLRNEIVIIFVAWVYAMFNVIEKGFNLLQFLNVFLFAILLNVIYVKYKNIIYTIAFNFIWYFTSNFIFSLNLEPSNIEVPSVINLIYGNYDILSGGEYGIFGSIVFLIVLMILDIVLIRKMGIFNKEI
ncbi:MAG: hypothetical protein N2594_05110 [Clostridiales bacterium]|nr:hypothetical protein [Clostridiales bacterium]